MPRKQKSIDEQLADARERQRQIKSRLDVLAVRKRQKDNKTRGKAQMTLMRVVLDQIAVQPAFKSTIAELIGKSQLRPDELIAIEWLLASLTPPGLPGASMSASQDNREDSGVQEVA